MFLYFVILIQTIALVAIATSVVIIAMKTVEYVGKPVGYVSRLTRRCTKKTSPIITSS